MIPNSYNSFAEIDHQLKILSLEKQIYKQRIKLSLNSSKNSFTATNVKTEFKGLLQERLLVFLKNYLFQKLNRQQKDEVL